MDNTEVTQAYTIVKANQKAALDSIMAAIDTLTDTLSDVRSTMPDGAEATDAWRAINDIAMLLAFKRSTELPQLRAKLDPPVLAGTIPQVPYNPAG